MSGHLLVMSVGPVQDFIAAARKTRDLWFGSHMLSEVSKAAARALAKELGPEQLIFPAPRVLEELNPDGDLIVANVILAELPPDRDPGEMAQACKAAAQDRWLQFAGQAEKEAGPYLRRDLWRDQVEDVIESYAAWGPLTADYGGSLRRVMRLLNGRKACREFEPARGATVPKSSLDGARESVLPREKERSKESWRRLRLGLQEELDVVGLTKRLAGGRQNYPSVSRVAADPWLRGVEASAPERFEQLKNESEALVRKKLLHHTDTRHARYGNFRYEGTTVYRNRYPTLIKELAVEEDEFRSLAERVEALEHGAEGRFGFGEPDSYLAVLVADGDRMGKAISKIDSAPGHREFSRQLSLFAGKARALVEKHRGVCIYAGGDDVLGLVPTDQCLTLSRELHEIFGGLLEKWSSPDEPLTLSVGVAIGHGMEALEDLLDFGRAAERAAKSESRENLGDERDGLAVSVYPRAQDATTVRMRWQDAPDQRLAQWAQMLNDGLLPEKAAYDLRELSRSYENWPAETPDQRELLAEALRADCRRLVARKTATGGEEGLQTLDSLVSRISSLEDARELAREIIIARRIAAGQRQAAGLSPQDSDE